MNFRISDTFTASLARLAGDEQKVAKTAAFDLQMNPGNPGLSLHKLDRARDRNFWSARVSRDLRLIVHRTGGGMLLCYVGHHDDAYRWAESRKIETHPTTGAAQIVVVRERIEKITIPRYEQQQEEIPFRVPLFAGVGDDDLLAWGVPPEWLEDVRAVSDDDALLALTDHLPAEAAEALLELATGGQPATPARQAVGADPFEHPDARRRFRTLENLAELERALESPWEQWTIFLHPAQREWVARDFSGPARVSGSAGTGKTVVALHRAVHLARHHPESRLLLATFSEALAEALRIKLRRLIGNEPRLGERIDVESMDEVALRLGRGSFGAVRLASPEEVHALVHEVAATHPGHGFAPAFLSAEWDQVVDAWQVRDWPSYRDVQRLGRRTRLPESRRALLWAIYEGVRKRLDGLGWLTSAELFERLSGEIRRRSFPPWDFVVIDEAQDIGVAQLRFLAALGSDRPNALFLAGDLGQRIFQQPFSWKSLGVDVRGRSRTLRVNYRTSHQIRTQADLLLDPELADVDGNTEARTGTVSVFNGPDPVVRLFNSPTDETSGVADWLRSLIDKGVRPHEMAIFVRSIAELARAQAVAIAAGFQTNPLAHTGRVAPDRIATGTMHLAKGLEFRAVAVMACDAEVIPSQERIESAAEEAELQEIHDTERHLLYVACTRARDHLHVSGVQPASEFLDDLRSADATALRSEPH